MVLYITLGAVVGALLRWQLGAALNPTFSTIPIGTLLVNVVGCFLIGILMEVTRHHSFVSEGLRLMLITGFLGSFTTFSTFSAETVNMLMTHQYLWSFFNVIVQVVGSLLATILGIYVIKFILFLGS